MASRKTFHGIKTARKTLTIFLLLQRLISLVYCNNFVLIKSFDLKHNVMESRPFINFSKKILRRLLLNNKNKFLVIPAGHSENKKIHYSTNCMYLLSTAKNTNRNTRNARNKNC